ncbi:MAG: hypothetical protein PHR44_03010 [Candidatus Omnitrophica bacterium]|nr:hypothetical protein [Candidatus Omnitrophota bacterium]
MENSVFIAKIFGLCYLILGVGFMFNRKAFQQVMDDFCKNAALVFYGGMLALVIGVVIILNHNIWVADWTVMITVIGWLALIKGIWIIILPNTVSKFMQIYRDNECLLAAHSALVLILGAVLTYFGFFAA